MERTRNINLTSFFSLLTCHNWLFLPIFLGFTHFFATPFDFWFCSWGVVKGNSNGTNMLVPLYKLLDNLAKSLIKVWWNSWHNLFLQFELTIDMSIARYIIQSIDKRKLYVEINFENYLNSHTENIAHQIIWK